MIDTGEFHAFGHRAGRVAHLEAQVPQAREHKADQAFGVGAPSRIARQEQQVEIRSGAEFPASVPADRQNRDRRDGSYHFVGTHDGTRQVEKSDHGAVGEPGAAAQESFERAVGFEPRTKRGVSAVHEWSYAGEPSLAVQRLARIARDRPQHVAHRSGRRCRIMKATEVTRLRSSAVTQRLCDRDSGLDRRRLHGVHAFRPSDARRARPGQSLP